MSTVLSRDLATRWAAEVRAAQPWPEYPRPQLARPHWQNLNGVWRYAITERDAPPPRQYVNEILVPYPLESALSGVQQALQPDQWLWYRRTVEIAPAKPDERVLLHFEAVDYEAVVYVNGQMLGAHRGGYQRFTFDITDALKAGENELVVRVWDPTDKGPNPHGKQKLHPRWMFYHASSGLWQTVWVERVPSTYIESLKLTPDVEQSELRIAVALAGQPEGFCAEAIASSDSKVLARQTFSGSTALKIDQPRLWSPDDPYLYDLEVRLLKEGQVVDSVKSYFGLRKIEVKADAEGRARIFLNNRYAYHLGVVDQGYWPEGLYTAPADAALKFDVQAVKALGFNTVRKHIKVEAERWYTHCDRLGVFVWQDMPSGPNDSPEARAQFEQEVKENLAQLHNHPSIITWVLFNEGWGAYEPERLAKWMKHTDPSRLVIGHSGPYDMLHDAQWVKRRAPAQLLEPLGGPGLSIDDLQRTQFRAPESWMGGDVADVHIYPGPEMFPAQAGMASVTGEHGSFGVYVEGHVWDETKPVGKGVGASGLTPQQFLKVYADSIEKLQALEAQGLSSSCYFELTDVEGEQQGLLTYDRAVAKVAVAEIARLNAALLRRTALCEQAFQGLLIETADPPPKDRAQVTEEQTDERRIVEIIARELIAPYFKDRQRKMSWSEFEKTVVERHGELGREAVLGARMMESLLEKDWAEFGLAYARYFETAIARSPYALHSLSYQVLEHVTDKRVLESAIRVMQWQIDSERDWPVFGRYDPTELDTYAGLLHKVGRTQEALEWQQKAVEVSGGRDPEICKHLDNMKSGRRL